MSLRDWFAGQALIGVIASPIGRFRPSMHDHLTIVARLCYGIADAMLATRSQE